MVYFTSFPFWYYYIIISLPSYIVVPGKQCQHRKPGRKKDRLWDIFTGFVLFMSLRIKLRSDMRTPVITTNHTNIGTIEAQYHSTLLRLWYLRENIFWKNKRDPIKKVSKCSAFFLRRCHVRINIFFILSSKQFVSHDATMS